mmetsp:Transcript_17821/g.26150  ORF Transcript_17821/g.26150 Transcript_17821/m.26150 type:complete len:252 (-) Transcript_17821:168-923(-)
MGHLVVERLVACTRHVAITHIQAASVVERRVGGQHQVSGAPAGLGRVYHQRCGLCLVVERLHHHEIFHRRLVAVFAVGETGLQERHIASQLSHHSGKVTETVAGDFSVDAEIACDVDLRGRDGQSGGGAGEHDVIVQHDCGFLGRDAHARVPLHREIGDRLGTELTTLSCRAGVAGGIDRRFFGLRVPERLHLAKQPRPVEVRDVREGFRQLLFRCQEQRFAVHVGGGKMRSEHRAEVPARQLLSECLDIE